MAIVWTLIYADNLSNSVILWPNKNPIEQIYSSRRTLIWSNWSIKRLMSYIRTPYNTYQDTSEIGQSIHDNTRWDCLFEPWISCGWTNPADRKGTASQDAYSHKWSKFRKDAVQLKSQWCFNLIAIRWVICIYSDHKYHSLCVVLSHRLGDTKKNCISNFRLDDLF